MLKEKIKIGIIICDRYSACAGGKCFRALKERKGAFKAYRDKEVEVTGFTTCGGCPGGNIEYSPEEMKNNGVQIIHFATGFIVGYPPCPYINYFKDYIEKKFNIKVIVGTHPIPQKYYITHTKIGTWESPEWDELLKETMCDEETRKSYD